MNKEVPKDELLPAEDCSLKTSSVLVITYYWPPAGGPGVQRWLKFTTYFREFGIEPTVYIPENPHYPLLDESLLSEIPEGITIIKQPIKEPYGFAKMFSKKKTKQVSSGIITNKKQSILEKIMLWIRGNFFIPDARVGWVKPSVTYLEKYISENKIDTIITTGPPHSLHLVGMQLKEKTNVKWLADFRDPWTTIHYHNSLRLSKNSQKKHKDLEQKVLNKADQIVVTSQNTKNEFSLLTKKPISVITNGYEASDNIHTQLDTQFTLVHIGSLLSNRNPEILWKVFSEITNSNTGFKTDLQIKLVGIVGDEIIESIQKYGLTENCEIVGYVSHQEAIQFQHNAQVLLLVEMDTPETKAIIPGKLFEYLAARRPVIALGPDGSDVETILTETNSGNYFLYSEEEKLKTQILTYYEKFKESNLVSESKNITKYSRRELTNRMSELLLNLKQNPR
ncbi:MAG: glycosyl transferase family 1 [Flavobacterium sp.]|nr:MAG: glycosyl transferase family 1 [Flavobacterium sp.]